MSIRSVALCLTSLALVTFVSVSAAETWNAEQKEIWSLEEQQWKMAAANDLSWIDTMVHPSLVYWETTQPMPRDKASLARWSKYESTNSTVLEHELFPISATITGNVAVVLYRYQMARENHKKERETVTGRYTDILIKQNGRWQFLSWSGGDDPKK